MWQVIITNVKNKESNFLKMTEQDFLSLDDLIELR